MKVHKILHFLSSGTFFRIVHHHGEKSSQRFRQNSKFSKSQDFYRKTMIFSLRFWWDVPFRARHGVSTRVATHVLGGLVNLITGYQASYAVEPLEQNWSFRKDDFAKIVRYKCRSVRLWHPPPPIQSPHPPPTAEEIKRITKKKHVRGSVNVRQVCDKTATFGSKRMH